MPKKKEVFSSLGPKRLNYFQGRLLAADDFQTEQDYFRTKLQQLNRVCLGRGIVEGLNVSCSGQGAVAVTPGIAVDRFGRLIELPQVCNFDLPVAKAAWDLFIELLEEPCDPQPTIVQENNAENGVRCSRIREVVKVYISQATDKDEEKGASSGVWLGTVQSSKNQCKVISKPPRKRKPST